MTHIEVLSARDNQFSDLTAAKVAAALEKNCSLVKLDLSNNYINDQGGEALAMSLEHNSRLTRLDLSSNNLSTTTGFKLVKQTLPRNLTLLYLNIDHNSIPINISNDIADLLAKNVERSIEDNLVNLNNEKVKRKHFLEKEKIGTLKTLEIEKQDLKFAERDYNDLLEEDR